MDVQNQTRIGGENKKPCKTVRQLVIELRLAKAEKRRLESERLRLKTELEETLDHLAGEAMRISKLESNIETARKTEDQSWNNEIAEEIRNHWFEGLDEEEELPV